MAHIARGKTPELGWSFSKADFLTVQEIREETRGMAKQIAESWEQVGSREEKRIAVISSLGMDQVLDPIFSYVNVEEIKRLEEEERAIVIERIYDALNMVRKKVIQELRSQVDLKEEDIYFIEKCLNITGRVQELAEGKIYKEHLVGFREYRNRTLKKLSQAMEDNPHPNVAYTFLEYDEKTGRALLEKINLDSLLDKINSQEYEQGKVSMEYCARIVLDNMEGAGFLGSQKLVIGDIKLSNLGVIKDKDTDRGALFDFDGLFEEGELVEGRVCTKGYFPPEAYGEAMPVKSAEMVYQFGVCLHTIIDIFVRRKPPGMQLDAGLMMDLDDLADLMTKKDPQERVALSPAIEELKKILENFL